MAQHEGRKIQSSPPSCRLSRHGSTNTTRKVSKHFLCSGDQRFVGSLTLDTGALDDLNVFETGKNVAANAESDLDAVLDTFLDIDRVLLDLCELLFGLLKVDGDDSARCCWRYKREVMQ